MRRAKPRTKEPEDVEKPVPVRRTTKVIAPPELPPREMEFTDVIRNHLRDLQERELQRRRDAWDQTIIRALGM